MLTGRGSFPALRSGAPTLLLLLLFYEYIIWGDVRKGYQGGSIHSPAMAFAPERAALYGFLLLGVFWEYLYPFREVASSV